MKTLSKLAVKNKFFDNDFYVFDVETNGLRARPDVFKFGVIYGANFVKVIYTIEEFQKEFEDIRYKKKKVFAHNAEFDLSVLYDNIYHLDSKALFNGRFIAATNGVCMFADSLNIFTTSVKEIGKLIGIHKKDIENEYKEGTVKIITEQMIDYCIRDCEIVFKALLQIFEMAGNIKITLAGLSMEYYRRFYQPFHIDYNEELSNEFFHSYYGGRTEAFHIGKVNAHVIDCNSMYPFAMLECKFPNPKYLRKKSGLTVKLFINKYLKNYEGNGKFTISHRNTYFGYLPLRVDSKLMFPVGDYTGNWNFNELRYALESKAIEIKKVHEICYATAMESPFKDFVIDNFAKRFDSTEFKSYLHKVIMNALYGKFAQKIDVEYMYIEDLEKSWEVIKEYKRKGMLIKLKIFNEERNDCFLELSASGKKYLYNTIPVFSSYITSFARVVLLKKMIENIENEVVYCDTDSVFVNKEIQEIDSKVLGMWKKERKFVTEIRGLKNYSFTENEKVIDRIKGVKKDAIKLSDNTFQYSSMVRTKESLRRNKDAGIWEKRTKVIKNTYDKRNVEKDGTTSPIKMGIGKEG
jgi:hypothetical protein